MISAIRSTWTWAALIALIVLWAPLVALVRLFDRDPARYVTGFVFRRLGMIMTRVNPAWRIHIEGERSVDPRCPYVMVCNHQSIADIPIISCLPWEMKWIAKAELLKLPILGWMMRWVGDIPVDRDSRSSGARVLVAARQYLRDRCSVIFFPEGTRSRDGRLFPFSDGAFRLAIKAQVPILPLVLDGTHGALPKNSWKFGAVSVKLRVLAPVQTSGLQAGDAPALRERIRSVIAAELAAWRKVSPEYVLAEDG